MDAKTETQQKTRYALYIDGAWEEPTSGRYLESVNPATGETWYEVPEASAEDVDRAVRAARKALADPRWSDMSPVDRGHLLRRIADLAAVRADETAVIESKDNGKVIREVRVQHRAIPRTWEYFAGWPDKLAGTLVPTRPSMLNYLQPEPVGVVAAILPWNSPLPAAVTKLAPALAAGNTVVIKPSSHTSASLLEFVSVLEDAGVPEGVVNVVTGLGATVGHELASHPDIDLINFTGGTEAGRHIAAAAARRPIRTILELGGKSPSIVFPDADITSAANGIIGGIFAAGGQTCVAGSRCFLHVDIYDQVLSLVTERAARIRLGDPLDETVDVGPLAYREHMERVLAYIDVGLQEGADLRLGGGRPAAEELVHGFFVEPTILDHVSNDMQVAREEIFGPVLCVIPFRDEEDVVRLANDSPYGLAAGVWTRDLSRAHRLAHQLTAGTVWVNTYRAFSPLSPFGGFRESGYGKESGAEVMREYTQLKSVWVDISGQPTSDPFIIRY